MSKVNCYNMKYEVNIVYKGQVNYVVDIPDDQLSEDEEMNKELAENWAAVCYRDNITAHVSSKHVVVDKVSLGTEYEDIENIVSKEVD